MTQQVNEASYDKQLNTVGIPRLDNNYNIIIIIKSYYNYYQVLECQQIL